MCFEDFATIPKLIQPLKALFAEDIVEMEERKERRLLKEAFGASEKLADSENEASNSTPALKKREHAENHQGGRVRSLKQRTEPSSLWPVKQSGSDHAPSQSGGVWSPEGPGLWW